MMAMLSNPNPRCRVCGREMRLESPIYGGPDEWHCPGCGEDPPPPASAPRRPLPKTPAPINQQHVTPVHDLAEHADSTDCPCGPRVEYLDEGSVVVHNAWDEREKAERAAELQEQRPGSCTRGTCGG